ncbi:MAG: methyltransferase type 11 [Candidatus Magnetoglobus multicellularis str. Araruama]|uniref:Methyltransferase type 11 n=1 Tax=Candidatus Magnetoglobus multicellularis str. Araruama TaxID=890399 RepID=A0A1V1PDK7_9BACT|nr:MAG: methyltransferase type 11 [Candidatus Magnetoglobus multicellularis str. Araruama]
MAYNIELPDNNDFLLPSEEYFFMVHNGFKEKIKLQDYQKIYQIPGLYDQIVGILKYKTPEVLSNLLNNEFIKISSTISKLTILELGAGNGIAGERLKRSGAKKVYGVDIIEEARDAMNRERPDVYEKYFIEDLSMVSSETDKALKKIKFNCLFCSSALSHISPSAFSYAFNLMNNHAWIVLNLWKKSGFEEGTGALIKQMEARKILKIIRQENYQHRRTVCGETIICTAMVGQKY